MNFGKYAQFYNKIYKNKNYKKEADMVYKWANQPRSILELGGGTGRHAQYWNKSKVTIIEKSLDMISEVKPFSPTFLIGDIRTFDYSELPKVDAVFAMFNVVGYADLIYYMDKLPLKEDGYFIFDCWDCGTTLIQPPTIKETTFGDIRRTVTPLAVDYAPYLRFKITIHKNNKLVSTEDHIVRSYHWGEIESLCSAFGYKIVDIKRKGDWVWWYKLQKTSRYEPYE